VVLQVPVALLHVRGEQLTTLPATQVPLPSHWLAGCEWVPSVQVAAVQTVPEEYKAHERFPEQTPVKSHVDTGSVAHSFAGS
jgi:hypothetical protein